MCRMLQMTGLSILWKSTEGTQRVVQIVCRSIFLDIVCIIRFCINQICAKFRTEELVPV